MTLAGFVLLAAISLFSSCKKDNNTTDPNHDSACSGCEVTTALATNDDMQSGVYKGLLLNGTGVGHFRTNVKNGDNQFFMVMKFTRDGNYAVLLDSLFPFGTVVVNGGSDIYADMRGSASQVDFYLNPVGQNVSVGDFDLSGSIGTGPKPQATAMKELSTEQVKVFEGTMQETSASGPNGKVGFVVRGNKIEGIITNANNTLRERFMNGTIASDNTFSFSFSGNNSVYSGQLTSATQISGSFTINGTPAGTFTAKRTL